MMRTTFKILLLIVLFSALLITSVNAAGILMNLQDYAQGNSNTVEEESELDNSDIQNQLNDDILNNTEVDEETNVVQENDEEEENNSRVTSSTTTSNDDEFLTTENVLSIIIIVIGILLVLLSIAILLRIK